MNRLSRTITSLNSRDSHHFLIESIPARIPLRLTPNIVNFTSCGVRNPRIIASAITGYQRGLDPIFPAMDPPHAPPPESEPPASEDFVHIETPSPKMEELSESIVKVEDELPNEGEPVSVDGAETEGSSEPRREVPPDELSRSVVVLTCESAAEGGTCDVYLVGTAHVSQVPLCDF